jgi:predicted dehydrogenase
VTSPSSASRRDFLTASAAATGAALLAHVPAVHAEGNDMLKIGLIGCGGRGTGAATQALLADPNVQLYAMGDAFADRIEGSLAQLKGDKTARTRGGKSVGEKVAVTPERCFSGIDAYKKVIDCCDVVLLATPPHFRPAHLHAAVEAGKHVFCEKPVAVDTFGAHSVLETCRKAKAKNTAVVSGLCYRYEKSKRETMKRIHDGQIGDVVAIHTNYLARGLWHKTRQQTWSDMEWQLRNWLYFTWLSGDHIVEQHIHSLDKCRWALKDVVPVKCVGLGGRQSRTGPEYGHIFDHHACIFEFPGGVKVFSFTRQQNDTKSDVNDYVMGTKGTASLQAHSITGENAWKHVKAAGDDMYQNEHDELFASIRKGTPINDGEWMTQSTLMAIMGRMATYTGQEISWNMVQNSKENLSPPSYEFGPIPVPPVAKPGLTKFV